MASSEDTPRFKKATIHEIFKQTWTADRLSSLASATEAPPKINDAALQLSAEYLRLFTIELIHRANKAAEEAQEGDKTRVVEDDVSDCLIEVKHLQQAAPGVLMDF